MEMNCIHLILLLLLLVLSYSCNGVAETSSSSSQVQSLPGFEGPLPFQLETGYIGVDDLNEVQLFYYFIPSERNPREDPLMLWHTGGPGCSAFSGLVFEIGPLRYNVVEYNGSLPTFVLNPYSWTKICSIIFLDAPVGTGFSYSTSSEGKKTSDTESAKQIYSFLRKWLNDHMEFSNNPLYIGGDSYTGKVVPAIVQEIADGIQAQHMPPINLKGYLLGNPLTEVNFDSNSKITFAHRMSFISDELYESLEKNCQGDYTTVNPRDIECAKSLQAASECTKEVNVDNVLEPWCPVRLLLNGIGDQRRSLDENPETSFSETQFPLFGCRKYSYLLSIYWANDDRVRDALHIKKGTIGEWRRCTYVSELDLYVEDIENAVLYHMNLSTRGYRSLIYSGDHDMMVPYIGTHAWIKSLDFSVIDDWRPWFVNTQVAGFTRTYSNRMTFATVKGAGHAAPEYMPKECLAMFTRWIAQNPL